MHLEDPGAACAPRWPQRCFMKSSLADCWNKRHYFVSISNGLHQVHLFEIMLPLRGTKCSMPGFKRLRKRYLETSFLAETRWNVLDWM